MCCLNIYIAFQNDYAKSKLYKSLYISAYVHVLILIHGSINTLRPTQNGRHFTDDILKWLFLNENVWLFIEVWLNFVSKSPINNIPALVQIMDWRRPGKNPLSEPMIVSLPTHICVTRHQWVNHNETKHNIMVILWNTLHTISALLFISYDGLVSHSALLSADQEMDNPVERNLQGMYIVIWMGICPAKCWLFTCVRCCKFVVIMCRSR